MHATASDPFSDLIPPDFIGGENGAPAFQTIGTRFEQVPRASLVTPNAFADLIPSQPDTGAFQDLIPPPPPQADLTSATEQAVSESAFNTRNEQISSAPTFMRELQSGNIHNAYRLAKDFLGQALEPTQKIEPGRGQGLLGTEEQIPAHPDDSLMTRAAKAVVNVTNRTAAGLTTPGMLPLAVIGGAGGATGRLLSAGFGATVAANAPGVIQNIVDKNKANPMSQEAIEADIEGAVSALMLAGAAKGTARPASASEATLATDSQPVPEGPEPVATAEAAGVGRNATATEPQIVRPSEGIPIQQQTGYARSAETLPPIDAAVAAADQTVPQPDITKPSPPVQPAGWQLPENIEPGTTAAIAELERQLGTGATLDVAPETYDPSGKKIDGVTVMARGANGETLGAIEAERLKDGTLEIYNSNLAPELRGQGQGVALYEKLIEEAKGSPIISDTAVSESAANVWAALKKRGVSVEKNPTATFVDGTWKTSDGSPVFSIKEPPPAPEILSSRTSPEEGNDWTQATAESGFKLKNAGEGGFITGDVLKAAGEGIDKAKEAAGMNIEGKASDLNVATTARSARLQQSFADAERAQKEIGKVLKTERRQNAASVWIEAGGDAATLQTWEAAAKGKMFKRAAADAQTFTPEEIAMAQKVRQTLEILETRGRNYDVLSNHRDNYVPHVWDVSKKFSGIGSSKLQDRFKFSKARSFNNFFEGDQADFIPKTLAIGKLVPAYLHEMNTVIADRQFVQDVSAGVGSDARPLLVPRGNAQAVDKGDTSTTFVNPRGFAGAKDAAGNPVEQGDYTAQANQPALSNWRFVSKDEAGNTAILKSDLATHPELTKRLNSMMGQSAVRQWYNEPSAGLSVIPKAIAKGIDTAQSTMKREMFGALAPFHQVQEGTHAVGHLVNPTFGLEDMSRPTPAHINAMQHGLMLLPEKQSSAAYIEGVGGRNTFLTQLSRKFGGKVGAVAADVVDGYQNYLFHQYIPALKFKTYEHILERNMSRYAKDIAKGEVTPADVKFLSTEQSNAAYGHLNYALLDRNPTMQHLIQIVALAPDFLEARGRFVGQALKGFASKSGFEQFRAIATLAAVQAGSAIVISSLMGDKWDPKHPFEVTHSGRTYTLRSVPEDLFRLLFSGPDTRREFVRARVNPLTGMGWQAVTGRNYRGEKVGFWDTVGETLANYIPITARSIPVIRNLTESGRNYPVSPLEQLMGSLGLKISRYSPITKTYQLAGEYKKANGIPADTGVYPVSKYQSLRYALEDADMDRAKIEYQKLRSLGMTSDKIRTGFQESINHPFTGTKASDEKFKKSLAPEARESYDQAVARRREILRKFGFVTR